MIGFWRAIGQSKEVVSGRAESGAKATAVQTLRAGSGDSVDAKRLDCVRLTAALGARFQTALPVWVCGDAAIFGARLCEPQPVRIFPDASIYFARALSDETAAGHRPALRFQSAARSAGVEAGQKLTRGRESRNEKRFAANRAAHLL